MHLRALLSLFVLPALALSTIGAGVVINEISYHPPGEPQDLEFIELYNASEAPVDLTGWKLARGLDHAFAVGTVIPADGFLVLGRNADQFKAHYGFAPAAVFAPELSDKGARLDLLDNRGQKVDSVRYKDSQPWPNGADGHSASLERICPTADGTKPSNWASSPLNEEMNAGGTPGQRNSNYSAVLPPVIADVKVAPLNPQPDQPITVEADIRDPQGVGDVLCRFRLAGSGSETADQSVPMNKVGEHRYTASIPGQKTGQLLRLRLEATNAKGARRLFPGANEPRPALSCFVHEKFAPGKIPFALVINVDPEDFKSVERHMRSPNQRGFTEEDQMRMMARMQLEAALDLGPVWFDLTTKTPLPAPQLAKLRTFFNEQSSHRDKLIDETADGIDSRKKMEAIPEVAKGYHARVAAAATPLLDDAQRQALLQVQARQAPASGDGQMRWTPDLLLKRLLNVENMFFKLTSRADINDAQFAKLASIYVAAANQRNALSNATQAVLTGKGDFDDVREKVQKISEDLTAQVKPVLTAAQARDWARSRNEGGFMPGQGRTKQPPRPRGKSAFVAVDSQTGAADIYDFVTVTERNAGLNVRFNKDRLFHGMSTVNVLFEYNDRFVLAEPLAYEFYRRLGNAAPLAEHMRLWVDGKPFGYYEFIEQPNRSFLERNHLKGDGNLYKILWYENSVEGQHEKKTNRQTGHEDVVELVDLLEKTQDKPDEQWAIIKKHFNVDQVINYFVVNMCLSHWDGFFNNYFAYHDSGGTDKWEMYPWDQDKTWGFYDGLGDNQVFTDMPLTMGMLGDRPPGWPKDKPAPRGIGVGASWWRAGGYFSKPLLANPHFRKLFLARTKQVLQTVYTEQVFFPLIDRLGDRLKEEVRIRATLQKRDPDEATETLQRNLQSLKDHLTKRRQFLLAQDELRSLGQ